MHCEMCSARMQKAFLDAKGVLKAEVKPFQISAPISSMTPEKSAQKI